MIMVDILPDGFAVPAKFMSGDYFRGVYGISVYPNVKVENVSLRVSVEQVQYLRTLPLHESQVEVVTENDYSIFEYDVKPNYEFMRDILALGSSVEVLAPMDLKKKVKDEINKMIENYNK